MGKKARKQQKAAKKQKKTANKGNVKKKQVQAPRKKESSVAVSDVAYPARILDLVGSMGTREGGRQVRVKLLEGRDVGKVIRRNVLGPVKIGDLLMLRETEIEANPLKGRKR